MDEYVISLLLICLSALFSGLTLGYFTLDIQSLKRQAKFGSEQARKILPIRKKGNQLLTSLLLGNVAVNAILSVYLSSIASGVVAAISATALIFLFGEIIPQAVISRHALYFGSLFAPLVKILLFITLPIAWPVSFVLNKVLGKEMQSVFSTDELKEIISEHEDSEHSHIDEDEERIVHGALEFSHTTAREVMTPVEDVVMYEENMKLTENLLEDINQHGFSRYPIYKGNRANVVGILFTKDLIIEENNIAIDQTEEAFESSYMKVRGREKLDTILARMLKQKRHMALVYNQKKTFIGVITLEDIIEEIIQVEIEDEDDD